VNDLPESLFADPVWHSLQTKHRHFALSHGDACRYPADVAPFAAVAKPGVAAMKQLSSLLAPEESLWIFGDHHTAIPELVFETTLKCLQMVVEAHAEFPAPMNGIVPLADDHAQEMVALTDIAFPGFFRARTNQMGSYYGIRNDGDLIAMSGERMQLDGYPEISGVCTHPSHRGKGLAAALISRLVHNHRRAGLISWLHVSSDNHHAIELYRRLGFRIVREIVLTRICRSR
jgi:ribosomal protein S18 acetylase RimI-like enzyme